MQEHEHDRCEEQCIHPEVIESVRREMLGAVPADELAQLFKVLGDNTRIRILDALFREGASKVMTHPVCCVGQVVEILIPTFRNSVCLAR